MSSIAIENTLNAEAREANRIKDEFLTTLSHELRTPLTAILGWARVLRTGPVETQRTERGLEVIERNVLAQTRLIDDLLDVSRIITGKLRLAVRSTNLAAVIDAALESMRPAAEAKEIEIRFERDLADGQDELIGDPDRLQQVVWNLISNAIKFTPARGRVVVGLSRRGPDFEICVEDSGKGISPGFLPSVFDRFQQADSSTTRTHGGLGIGLAIVRHLVELHGGAVSAESDGDERGSTFRVWLPAVALGVSALERERALPPPSTPAPGRDKADLTGLRVLLVEDERDGRELLTETVRAAGAETLAAESASEAFQSLATFRPDVLVSDVAMPVEDGYSLVRRMRRLAPEEGGRIPAIAVSAYAREEDRIRSLAAGFQHHIAKPLDPAELIGAIARLARRSRVAPVAAEAPTESPSISPSPSPAAAGGNGRPKAARVLIVEDDGDAREGLRSLLEMWGHEVDVAEDGLRGIEKAVATRPDVALIDVGLPGIDGYQVAIRLAEVLGEHSIFLVALTGYASAEDRTRAFECGFHAHLAKPINYAKLSSLLSDEGNRRSAPLENASEG